MRVGIGKITKELGVKSYMLHKWEERGWLGHEPVLKDPENNNQRVYSEEQVERIEFVHSVIEDQRKRGIKRTDFEEVEEKLLDKFGGEVTRVKEEMSLLPSTVEEFQMNMVKQTKMMADVMDQFSSIQNELQLSHEREDNMTKKMDELLSHFAEQEKQKMEMKNEMELLKSKLDMAVDYIQKQENENKKGFFRKLFG